MWTKRDWVCVSVSAAAAFGLTLVGFWPTGAIAENPSPAAVVINTPRLTIDGVSISADTVKDFDVAEVGNATIFFVGPGPLPKIELRASNTADSDRTVRFSASILTSRVPNPMSRVAMPATRPASQWTQDIVFDLKPGESKEIQVSTEVKLAAMSSATLRLEAGAQKIDMLTISTMPRPTKLDAKASR